MRIPKFLKPSRKALPREITESAVIKHKKIKGDMGQIEQDILEAAGYPADLVVRRIEDKGNVIAVILYLETLVDANHLGLHVIQPLNRFVWNDGVELKTAQLKLLLSAGNYIEVEDLHNAEERLLSGYALVIIKDTKKILAVSMPGFAQRKIEDAQTEKNIKGPREGFNETLYDNISLIRRSIKDPNLRIEKRIIGERTKTEVAVIYLNDVANPDMVKEVFLRLEQIKIDGILESGYIAEMISDRKWTPFPLVQETERSDKVLSGILEGRVAIMVDRSPFNIILPATSNEFYQTSEDFYFNWITGTTLRLIRAIGTIIAVTLPGFYLAMITVNPELLPPTVVQLEAGARTQLPFPAILELGITFFAFEVLREASVRFPTNINMVLGVGGGIVMGIAAINAGVLSGITLAVVVFTILAGFTTSNPAKEQAWRWVRYLLLAAGAAFGFIGVILAGVLVLAHMAGLKSFGVSYLAPWAPPLGVDIADSPVRLPWWASYRRPPTWRPQQEDRLGKSRGGEED